MSVIGWWILVLAAVMMLMACIPWRQKGTDKKSFDDLKQDDATLRSQEREAHYMRNFWSYDGSEQKEWDE